MDAASWWCGFGAGFVVCFWATMALGQWARRRSANGLANAGLQPLPPPTPEQVKQIEEMVVRIKGYWELRDRDAAKAPTTYAEQAAQAAETWKYEPLHGPDPQKTTKPGLDHDD